MELSKITLLMLDVDGVMTEGTLAYDVMGETFKVFNAVDGFAIKCWQRAGHEVAILSGRHHVSVETRARDLGIEWIRQGVQEKGAAYRELLGSIGLEDGQVCFVGDDGPDLRPMRVCGFPVAVANASPPARQVAEYVTVRSGGRGAIAEVVELVLRKQGRWSRELLLAR